MSAPRTGDLSMSMAVLGLLVEQADTVGGFGFRLVQRFPDARWSRSAVYGCVPSLVKQGHARLVKEGSQPALNRYGATSSGVAYFREWKRESAVVPPVSRDALQGKLVFATRGDVSGLIGTVRAKLDACRQKYTDVHRSYLEARGLKHRSADWDAVMLRDQVKLWEAEVQRLRELLEDLEGFRGELPESLAVKEAAGG
jgi:hypothetical protein